MCITPLRAIYTEGTLLSYDFKHLNLDHEKVVGFWLK